MDRGILSLTLAASLLLACSSPVTVKPVNPRDVYQSDSASTLDSGVPTRFTNIELHRTAISAEEDPLQRFMQMRAEAIRDGRPESMLAVAELAYLEGQRTGQKSDFLGAAVYAYLYLFGAQGETPASAWDPRSRIAADIYNRALARAFSSSDNKAFLPTPGVRQLPIGHIQIDVPRRKIAWEQGVEFASFLPADVFEVSGLAARYRRPGLGAPLIAMRTDERKVDGIFPARLEIPATAFLRVEGGVAALRDNELQATLELYDPQLTPSIEVEGQTVPLEAQTTTAYAHLLREFPVWQSEIMGFFSGDEESMPPGITLLEAYRPNAIPVILVHGTASSAARWAGMVNDLNNDSWINEHFQFWFFTYRSGNPIGYSAARLRAAIAETVELLDPDGNDLAAHEMVLIGHSQGGLLVRLAISDSTDVDWQELGLPSLESLKIDDESRQAVAEVLNFTPTPGVRRAVFIATPHRGSFVAGGWMGKLGARLVSVSKSVLRLPFDALRVPIRLASGQSIEDAAHPTATAVGDMAPDSRFIKLLQQVPMSPDVARNSIIAVNGDGDFEKGNDGVVAYQSAHLADAESELVVRSGHSVQSDPRAVAEVRRILAEQLATARERPSPQPGAPRESPTAHPTQRMR